MSAPGPFGYNWGLEFIGTLLGLGIGGLELWVWGQGLTIFILYRTLMFKSEEGPLVLCYRHHLFILFSSNAAGFASCPMTHMLVFISFANQHGLNINIKYKT